MPPVRPVPTRRPAPVLLLALLVTLVSGCPSGPGARPSGDAAAAARYTAQGRHEEAGDIYERLARTAGGTQRDALYLDASRAWLEAGQAPRALNNLDRVQGGLPKNDNAIELLIGYRYLRDGVPDKALEHLDRLRATLPQRYLGLWYELRGRAFFQGGDHTAGVGALVERELWLLRGEDIRANRELIWRALTSLAEQGDPLEPGPASDAIIQGWFDLARAAKTVRSEYFAGVQEVRTWQEAYPTHPALYVSQRLLDEAPDALEYPQNVALLLPLRGRFAGTAAAVRDGFLAAYLQDTARPNRPVVRIYDTSGDRTADTSISLTAEPDGSPTGDTNGVPSGDPIAVTNGSPATDALRLALQDGAQFVVGPLLKQSVEAVAAGPIDAGVMALNILPDDAPPRPNFFQFSLAPEHEAAAVARRAVEEGLMRAVALVPNNDWGERMMDAFTTELHSLGGQLLSFRTYETPDNDFAAPITELLNLNESRERYRQVAAVTGLSLEFTPRRRQDVEFVFVAADPRQGRLIRPAFLYHFAEDLPVFATSAIYADDPAANGRDLEGLVFADMPWVIAPDATMEDVKRVLGRYWPSRVNRRARLYAMGYDAYRLIPRLTGEAPLAEPFEGATGELLMGPDGRIMRRLDIAEIRGGTANVLGPVHETDPLDLGDGDLGTEPGAEPSPDPASEP